jgi:hypothetical protein
MVPLEQNAQFFGRTESLKGLRALLHDTEPIKDNSYRIALYGPAGVGKTQLVTEYVYEYRDDYDAIFWISAADNTLVTGFQDIAESIGCLNRNSSPAQVVESVLAWFREHDKWLLVIDNLDDIHLLGDPRSEDLQLCYFPDAAPGRHTVLITAAHPNNLGDLVQGLEIGNLEVEEATKFLLHRSQLHGNDSFEKAEAVKIVEELGCLPLAIE